MMIIQREWEAYTSYATYVDIVWENKNKKVALIKFKENANSNMILGKMTQELSLFDVMTNISNFNLLSIAGTEYNMYNCIDWD